MRVTGKSRCRLGPSWVLGCAALLLMACGCTPWRDYFRNGFKVGPNYCPPAAPVETDWIDAADVRLVKEPSDLREWWRVFNDPTLDALVTNTIAQNLTLREAGFRVLQARAARAIAVGEFFPQQQDMFGSYTRYGLSFGVPTGVIVPQRFFDQWTVGFNLAWELDFWGRYRRGIEAADADLDASVENYDAVVVTLLGDVASTYVNIRTFQRQLALVRTNVELQRQTLTLVDARYRGGQVSELDVDQAASTLAQTEAMMPQLELSIRMASNQLCILLGMPPENLQAVLGEGPIPVAPTEVIVGIPAELLARRPDVRRAEREAAAQSARVGVAVSELYPHIAITGTVASSSSKFGDLLSSNAFNGAVGPGFQWNLLNYGRLASNIVLHDARLQELVTSYQNTVLNAEMETENGIAQFLQSQAEAQYLAKSVEAAERATKIVVTQYRSGMVDFNRVSLIEQNLVQQQDQYAQAVGQIAQGLIATYRALGGGWQIRLNPQLASVPIPAPPPDAKPKIPWSGLPEPMPAPNMPEANVPGAVPHDADLPKSQLPNLDDGSMLMRPAAPALPPNLRRPPMALAPHGPVQQTSANMAAQPPMSSALPIPTEAAPPLAPNMTIHPITR